MWFGLAVYFHDNVRVEMVVDSSTVKVLVRKKLAPGMAILVLLTRNILDRHNFTLVHLSDIFFDGIFYSCDCRLST